MAHVRLLPKSDRVKSIYAEQGLDLTASGELHIGRGPSGSNCLQVPPDWAQVSTKHCRLFKTQVRASFPHVTRACAHPGNAHLGKGARRGTDRAAGGACAPPPVVGRAGQGPCIGTVAATAAAVHHFSLFSHPAPVRLFQDGWAVEDTSTNGTFVDGIRVPKRGTLPFPLGGTLRLSVGSSKDPGALIECVGVTQAASFAWVVGMRVSGGGQDGLGVGRSECLGLPLQRHGRGGHS